MLRVMFSIVTILIAQNANACKLVQTIVGFKVTQQTNVPSPIRPNFKIAGIHRGNKLTGAPKTSCSWLVTQGSISLQLLSPPQAQQGYIFEIVDGVLGDNSIFSKKPVMLKDYARNKNKFSFRWTDYPETYRKPINIKIKITAISLSGEKSKPQYLEVFTKRRQSFFSQVIN